MEILDGGKVISLRADKWNVLARENKWTNYIFLLRRKNILKKKSSFRPKIMLIKRIK